MIIALLPYQTWEVKRKKKKKITMLTYCRPSSSTFKYHNTLTTSQNSKKEKKKIIRANIKTNSHDKSFLFLSGDDEFTGADEVC